jgi:hypothetical protein
MSICYYLSDLSSKKLIIFQINVGYAVRGMFNLRSYNELGQADLILNDRNKKGGPIWTAFQISFKGYYSWGFTILAAFRIGGGKKRQ